ncbi:uncharacterized protein VSU04_011660 isoform 3-T4 [Chlamydotis macqueenii]
MADSTCCSVQEGWRGSIVVCKYKASPKKLAALSLVTRVSPDVVLVSGCQRLMVLCRSPQPRFACQSFSVLRVRARPCVRRLPTLTPASAPRVEQQGLAAEESPGPTEAEGRLEPVLAWGRRGKVAEQSLSERRGTYRASGLRLLCLS